MASETRKLQRAQGKKDQATGKDKRAQLKQPLDMQAAPAADPFGPEAFRKSMFRVGLIVAALLGVGALIAAMSQTRWVTITAMGVSVGLSAVVVGVLVWTARRARAAREVQSLMQGVNSAEDRRAVLEKLESEGSKDPAKIFARAQLEMQEDPKKALATLEQIDLAKNAGVVADEARGQRAMIHLVIGQVNLARQLVDNIDLKRQQDSRSRALLSSISAEAWARSGEAEKALTTLAAFDLKDEQLAPLRPQLLRSRAFAEAHAGKMKDLKRTLKQMLDIDPRLLGSFLQGKPHPLLQKEAKRMIEQSGIIPRKMTIQRGR